MKHTLMASMLISVGLLASTASVAQSQSTQATASAGQITLSDCWIRQMPAPTPSGGFFLAHNGTDQELSLSHVKSADYGMIMLHQTTHEDGISKMSEVENVAIPAGGDLAFKPGSYHIMLEEPRAGLEPGGQAQLEFFFSNGQSVSATCELKSPKDMPPMSHHDHARH